MAENAFQAINGIDHAEDSFAPPRPPAVNHNLSPAQFGHSGGDLIGHMAESYLARSGLKKVGLDTDKIFGDIGKGIGDIGGKVGDFFKGQAGQVKDAFGKNAPWNGGNPSEGPLGETPKSPGDALKDLPERLPEVGIE